MTVTITTASGAKVRTARSTRFVVVLEAFTEAGLSRGAEIEKGSNSLDTLRTHLRRKGRRSFATDGRSSSRRIFDLRERRFVED